MKIQRYIFAVLAILLVLEGCYCGESIEDKIKRIIRDPEFEESVGLNPIEIIWPYDYTEEGKIEKGTDMDPIMFNTEGKLHNFKITVISNISVVLYLSKKENPSPTNYEFKSLVGKETKIVIYPTDGSTGDYYLRIHPLQEGKGHYLLKIEPSFNWFMYMVILGGLLMWNVLRYSAILSYAIKRYIYLPSWFFAVLATVISLKMAIHDRMELITLIVGLYLVFLGYRGRLFVINFAIFYYMMDSDVLLVLANSLSRHYHSQSDFLYFVVYHERLLWLFVTLYVFHVVISEAIYYKKELSKFLESSESSSFVYSPSYWFSCLLSLNIVYFVLKNFNTLDDNSFYLFLFLPTLLVSLIATNPTRRKYCFLVLTNAYGAFMLVHYIPDPSHKAYLGLFWFVFGVVFQLWNGNISQDDHSIHSKNFTDSMSTEESVIVKYSSSSEENAQILMKTLQTAFESRRNSPNEMWEEIFKNAYVKVKQDNK